MIWATDSGRDSQPGAPPPVAGSPVHSSCGRSDNQIDMMEYAPSCIGVSSRGRHLKSLDIL